MATINDLLHKTRQTQEGFFEHVAKRGEALGYPETQAFMLEAFKAGFCEAITWVNEVAETLKQTDQHE